MKYLSEYLYYSLYHYYYQGNTNEKEKALALICQLSFVNSNKQAIAEDISITQFLKVMAKDQKNM